MTVHIQTSIINESMTLWTNTAKKSSFFTVDALWENRSKHEGGGQINAAFWTQTAVQLFVLKMHVEFFISKLCVQARQWTVLLLLLPHSDVRGTWEVGLLRGGG